MAERPVEQTTPVDEGAEAPSRGRGLQYLPLAYLWPALLWGLALGSALLAYLYFVGYAPEAGRARYGNLDRWTYYGFEGLVLGLLAWLSTRAVRRARRGKDLWTMRAYWPTLLGLGAALSLTGYLLTIIPARGCSVGPLYALYGCWDPGVTLLRTTLALALTAGFTFGIAAWAEGLRARRAERDASTGDDEDAAPRDEDAVEEIPAR